MINGRLKCSSLSRYSFHSCMDFLSQIVSIALKSMMLLWQYVSFRSSLVANTDNANSFSSVGKIACSATAIFHGYACNGHRMLRLFAAIHDGVKSEQRC